MHNTSIWKTGNPNGIRGTMVGILTFLLLGTTSPPAGALSLVWQRTWGGPNLERGEAVAVAPDGSVYLAGQTNSFGTGVADEDLDLFLIKYNRAGSIVWQRTYGVGRPEPNRHADEFAADVEVAPDGSVYVAGTSSDGSFLLLRLDSDGNVIWEKTWGEGGESPRGMDIGPDGSIYVVGFTFFFGAGGGDALLLKFSPDGTLVMQRTWGGTNFEIADDVAVGADGSIYVAGDGNSFFANDAFLVKFAPDGAVVWERDWREGDTQGFSAALGVAIAPDGNVYMAGRAQATGSGQNAALVKFTPEGTIVWERTWLARVSTGAAGIVVGPDGSIYITGNTNFGVEGGDAFVTQFMPDGRVERAATWEGANVQGGQAITLGPDGNLYVAASTSGPPPYRFRTAPKKVGTPSSFLGTPIGTVTTPIDSIVDPDLTVLTPSGSQTYAGGDEAVLLRIAPMGASTALQASTGEPIVVAPKSISLAQNNPNPFALKTDVSFRLKRDEDVSIVVLDVQGRLVKTLASGPYPAGEHRVSWDGRNELRNEVAAGTYFYRIQAGEASGTRKMILMRR